MGHNPIKNPFRRARLGLDDRLAFDEFKARSVRAAWWALGESVRRRFEVRTLEQPAAARVG